MGETTHWMWQFLLVGTGGFVGSICRFSAGGLIYRLMPGSALPYGTLAVNVLGCFAIGLVTGGIEARGGIGDGLRWLLIAGFLGGFTTFSAFGFETFALLRDATHMRAILNVAFHLIGGLAAVWAGYSLVR